MLKLISLNLQVKYSYIFWLIILFFFKYFFVSLADFFVEHPYLLHTMYDPSPRNRQDDDEGIRGGCVWVVNLSKTQNNFIFFCVNCFIRPVKKRKDLTDSPQRKCVTTTTHSTLLRTHIPPTSRS